MGCFLALGGCLCGPQMPAGCAEHPHSPCLHLHHQSSSPPTLLPIPTRTRAQRVTPLAVKMVHLPSGPPAQRLKGLRCWKAPAPPFPFSDSGDPKLCLSLSFVKMSDFCKNPNTCSNSSLVILLMLHTSLNSPKHKEL